MSPFYFFFCQRPSSVPSHKPSHKTEFFLSSIRKWEWASNTKTNFIFCDLILEKAHFCFCGILFVRQEYYTQFTLKRRIFLLKTRRQGLVETILETVYLSHILSCLCKSFIPFLSLLHIFLEFSALVYQSFGCHVYFLSCCSEKVLTVLCGSFSFKVYENLW